MSDALRPSSLFSTASPATAPSGVLATVPNPPPEVSQLPAGTTLRGVVIGNDDRGHLLVRTDLGTLAVNTRAHLPPGSDVVLQIRGVGPQLQILLMHSDQAPGSAGPRGGGQAATAPVGHAATPDLLILGQSVRATVQAPATALANTAGPLAGTDPSVATALARLAPGSQVVLRIVAVDAAAGAPAPAGSAPPAPPQASQAGATPVLSSSVPLAGAAPGSTVAAANSAAGVLPAALSAQPGPAGPPAPGTTPQTTGQPTAGQPATGATPAASSAVPAPAASPGTPPSAPAAAAPASPGALGQPAAVPTVVVASEPASTASPASPPPAAGLPPGAGHRPAPASSLLPSLDGSQRAPVTAELAAARAVIPAATPGATPVATPVAFPGAPSSDPAGASATARFSGLVTATTNAGQPVLQTPVGTLTLDMRAALPLGSRVIFDVVAGSLPRGDAAPASLSGHLGRAWPALEEVIQTLRHAAETAGAPPNPAVVPQPGSRLASGLLFFIAALNGGDMGRWLGGQAAQTLKAAGRGSLLGRLGRDFAQLGRPVESGGGDWRLFLIPLLDGQQVQQLRLFERHGSNGRGGTGDKADGEATRFVLEVELTRLGDLQLDGLVRQRRFDLILRTRQPLPAVMRQDITDIFSSANEATGYTGSIGFQASPGWRFMPIAERAGAAAGSGLVI